MNITHRRMGSATLLWFRQDVPRHQAQDYWRGPHAQLVARSAGFLEYRQHHFAADSPGRWPATAGVETRIPDERRVDGTPEVVFTSPASALRNRANNARIHLDEANAFRRTILHVTGPRGTVWAGADPGEGARTVLLLRRRAGVPAKAFASFVQNDLLKVLTCQPGLVEVRSMIFLAWNPKTWDTPGVAHDYPEDQQFHAWLSVAASDRSALAAGLAAAATALGAAQQQHLSALHAYDVEAMYVYRRENRPTLPQTSASGPAAKPRLRPAKRSLSPRPTRSTELRSALPLVASGRVELGGVGPEDITLDAAGRLLCGVDGGRVLRIDPDNGEVVTIGDTGGRPLGLDVQQDGRVLVCDAHRGLLRLDPDTGRIETLVQYVRGLPLRFCSNAATEPDGTIWFTESTTRFDFEHYVGAMLEHRPSGRLLRRGTDGAVEVVLDYLDFANGVTLTPDGSALLFAETGLARVSRLELHGPSAGSRRVVAELPGYPDNLSRFVDGRTWLGIPGPRDKGLEGLASAPAALARAVWALPERLRPAGPGTTWLMAIDEHGAVQADLQSPDLDFPTVTGVVQRGEELFCVSTTRDSLLRVPLPGIVPGAIAPGHDDLRPGIA